MMLCCVCLLERPHIMQIFDDLGIQLNVADIINKHLRFKPLLNDVSTSHICTECWHKIKDFHQFYESVEKVHKEFKSKQSIIIKEEDKHCLSKIKQEYIDEIDLDDNIIQTEDEIFNNISQNIILSNPKNPLDDNVHEESEEDYKLFEENNQECEAKESKNNKYNKTKSTKVKNRKKRKKSEGDFVNKVGTDADKTKKNRVSNRLDPIQTDKIIQKYIQMACNLCIFVGKTFSDIVEHFKEHHNNVKPYIMCCDKKFTRSYCIAQHAYIHDNPNSFSCSECKKSFTTSYGLRIHKISYHASEEERTHACEHCPRKFGRRNLLELHKQTHIPREQWTIVCTKCTNRTAKFATQYMLNIHTSMYHRREINICQVCAKEIKDKKSFEKHVRSHYEDSGPRLKCPIGNCESWLKDKDNLKTHIQRYHLDDKTYKCPDCDKVCPNRRSLSSHKHYFHSKEIFRCDQCNKTFKKALTLKEHMTQHTGETLYNCPFCTRTFNSNANMHAHKKKQHPAEWEELRRKKLGPMEN